MTYFQNIHSLADLKKEYRRLALEHHPDKGGDTTTMQQVNIEFEGLFEIWKDKPDVPTASTGYEHDYPGATAKEYTEYVHNEYRWKGRNYRGSTPLKSWNWCGHGSGRPTRDTSSLSDGRITIPFISG